MHYDSRPTWRYQWSAALAIVAMLVIVALSGIYGPAHIGLRMTHLLSSAAAAMAVYFLLLAFYRRLAWRFIVDDHNVESFQGVLGRQVHSIRLGDLRNIVVRQSLMQRLFGVGDVEFSSVADPELQVVFFGVAEPIGVKDLVQRLQGNTAAREPE